MIFYVYFDPEIISFAQREGPYAMQSLIAILRGFLQNCFVAEFEDQRLRVAIKRVVSDLPDDWDRKTLTQVLGVMSKRHLFISCLTPNYMAEQNDLDCVFEQACGALIDVLLLTEPALPDDIPEGIETATLADYQHTYFEQERSRLASEGRAFKDGQLDEREFLDRNFKKMLRYATSIEICDKLFGKKYKGNYIHTARTLLVWLEQTLADPVLLTKLVFYCGVPGDEARGVEAMKTEIASLKQGRLSELRVELQFYGLEADDQDELPHDRFIVTDQIAIGVPRGIDFLNAKTRRNRDVTLDYKNRAEVEAILKSYEHARGDLIVL